MSITVYAADVNFEEMPKCIIQSVNERHWEKLEPGEDRDISLIHGGYGKKYYIIDVKKKCKVRFRLSAYSPKVTGTAKLMDENDKQIFFLYALTSYNESASDTFDVCLETGRYYLELYGNSNNYENGLYSGGVSLYTSIIATYEDEENTITVSDNKPMEPTTVQIGDYTVTYNTEVPFWGKKIELKNLGEITISKNGLSARVTKAKINKRTNRIQIINVDGFSKQENKAIKKSTKGSNGLTFKINPYWVSNDDNIILKQNKQGSVKSVKILLNGKYYKVKKSEFDYIPTNKTVYFYGNLAGRYTIH